MNESLLCGFRPVADAPILDVYDDLAERYPEAKVILSVRDPGVLYFPVRTTYSPEVH